MGNTPNYRSNATRENGRRNTDENTYGVVAMGMELYGDSELLISEPEMSSNQSLPSLPDIGLPGSSHSTEQSFVWGAALTLASTATSTATTVPAEASFPATVKRPLIDAFAGQFGFDIQPSRHQEDGHWVYSQLLDKVFTDIGKSVRFNVSVRTDVTPSIPLFIRALPLFLPESDSFEEVVKTCPTHQDSCHMLNSGCPAVKKHVVRCSDPQAEYQHDPQSDRYSVVTRLSAPQPGATGVPLLYTFACKNSCRGGIGRRALAVVFTLEGISGEILGRRVIEVRVCSCPRRDKNKQEQQYLRQHSRNQSEDVQSETKAAIQQLMRVSRSQPLQEVPQVQVATEQHRDVAQESGITALSTCSHVTSVQGQQAELPCMELTVLQNYQREIMRQATAILWRDAGENQLPLSEYDTILLQIYKEGYCLP